MPSQSSSSSTLILFLIFAIGSGAYFTFRWTGDESPEPPKPSPIEIAKDEPDIPNSFETKRAKEETKARNRFWKELNDENFVASRLPHETSAHGLSLLLNPDSTAEDIIKGITLIDASDDHLSGARSRLQIILRDQDINLITRRNAVLGYLVTKEKHLRLFKYILHDSRRIKLFSQLRMIPLEGEPWPIEELPIQEPPDEEIYHQNMVPENNEPDLPAGLPVKEDFLQPIELIPDPAIHIYESDAVFED